MQQQHKIRGLKFGGADEPCFDWFLWSLFLREKAAWNLFKLEQQAAKEIKGEIKKDVVGIARGDDGETFGEQGGS